MPNYVISEVRSKKDLGKFIGFPLELYKNCPQYVPALNSDQIHSLTACSTLEYCKSKMWMVMDGKKVVGRICAMINPRYNERFCTKRARFGWFDTVDDMKVASLLLGTAEAWARENGMDEIHGPLYYNTLGKQGMLVEGFDNVPPFNCLYNFSYYSNLVSALGYEKECDWVQYRIAVGQEVPQRVVDISNRLLSRYKLKEVKVSEMKKNRKAVHDFFRMYSDSFAEAVYNFIPFTDEEIEEEAKSVMNFLQDDLCCFLEDETGSTAAFGVGFPSISGALQAAKGRLFPFGWLYLLRAMRRCDTVDLMLNGAAPKWQHSGISSVYHVIMSRKYRKKGVKWGITNPQIDTNMAVNVWDRYSDKELFMRRRCWIKKI